MKTRTFAQIEILENRIAPAGVPFAAFATDINTKLIAIQAGVDTSVLIASNIPVVGGKITEAARLFDSFANQLENALTLLGDGPSDLQIQTAIFNVIGPNGLLGAEGLLGNNDGIPGITKSDVVINHNPGLYDDTADNFTSIDLHLLRTATLVSAQGSFDIGLKSLPFEVSATGGVDVIFGFDYSHLKFSYGVNSKFHFDATTPDELSVSITASLHPGSNLKATVGFLNALITDNPSAPTTLTAGFLVDVKTSSPTSNTLIAPTFKFTGEASVNLKVDAGITKELPGIGADFSLHWGGPSTPGNATDSFAAPTVEFQNVRVNLGSAISTIAAPIVDILSTVLKPVQPVVDFITAPIPVLSDLSHALGQGDITLLGIADLAQSEIPEGYKELFTVASAAVKVLKFVEKIQNTEEGGISLPVGGFFAAAESDNGQDLRITAAAKAAGTALNNKDISSLVPAGFAAFDANAAINALGLENTSLGQELKDTLDSFLHPNGITYSFPFLDHPEQAVFGLLLGRDATLFTLDAKLKVKASFAQSYPIALGFSVGFAGTATVDLQLHLGYDTFGIREALTDISNNVGAGLVVLDLLDGIYMTTDTHAHLDANIAATAGLDIGIASIQIEGGVALGIHIDPPTEAQMMPKDNDPTKIHFRKELTDRLFNVEGSLDAFLDVVAKVGIGPLSISKHFDIAHVNILNFGTNAFIPNPFSPPVDLHLATSHAEDQNVPEGTLRLNVGADAVGRGVSEGVTSENYQVFVGGKPDEITVVAFGYAQSFSGIHHIIADAGDGNDSIIFNSVNEDAPMTADVKIIGGDGNDQLAYHGTGAATLLGSTGDDVLIGGAGVNYLNGGEGDDHLTGGASTNHLGAFMLNAVSYLENGNDKIRGGDGLNLIDGGGGNDALFAGKTDGDILIGGLGDDQFTANIGKSSFLGGQGDDTFLWKAGDGRPNVLDGGNDRLEINTLSMDGSISDDTVVLSKNSLVVNNTTVKVALVMGSQNFNFPAKSIHNFYLEGGAGADHLTVNSLAGTTAIDVGLNLGDVLRDKLLLGDGVADVILVNGNTISDTAQIRAEQVQIAGFGGHDPIIGGVMKLTGLPSSLPTQPAATYTVRLANVADDFTYSSGGGNDQTTIFSNTGPTRILAGAGNDGVTIVAKTNGNPLDPFDPANPKDYISPVNVDFGTGLNTIFFQESEALIAETIDLSSTQYHSILVW